jgi:hypothetical protein
MNSELWPIDGTQRLEIGPLRGSRCAERLKDRRLTQVFI